MTRTPKLILPAALAALSALMSLSSVPAAAQGWNDRPWWEGRPRLLRPPPRYEDDAYDPYAQRRWRRPGWRLEERGWTRSDPDDGTWDGEDDAPETRRGRPRRDEADSAQDWQDEAEDATKAAGTDGGQRPTIAPRAPSVVPFAAASTYKPGSIVIDTSARRLYYVRNAMSAFAYPIGVGRDGFSWTGKETVSRIADWPDWYPPAEMRKRKPELPERMLGGLKNPLGAKAIYLGNTLYRIHGTNDPNSIGRAASSGCFRMLNGHALDLAGRVDVGTPVTVVSSLPPDLARIVASQVGNNRGPTARNE